MKDKTISIPASSFRSIKILKDEVNSYSWWISLAYEELGAKKFINFHVGFFPNNEETINQVHHALRAVPQVMHGVTHREFFITPNYD